MGDAGARPVISEKAHAECVRLLELLTNKRVQESWSWVFMAPVTGIPGYHDVIKKPMDLGTVKKNLGSKPSRCRFKSHEKFAKDVRLVFQNALVYNKEDEQVKGSVFYAAQHLLRVFETAYAKAKETVFKDEDDAAEHNSSTNEEPDAGASVDKDASRHHSSSHAHGHSSSEHESSSKHKKDKSSKKEKKSKKSKKKSKDKDKEKDRDKHKERSKDRDREHKSSSGSSSAATDEPHKKSHSDPHTSHRPSSGGHDHTRSVASASVVTAPESMPTGTSGGADVAKPKAALAAVSASSAEGKMSEDTVNACLGVLMKLIKYKEGNVSPAAPFLQPVDLMHFPDYKIKVPNRMHLYGVQKKLRSGGYATIDTFAYDVRLVFSNCLVYNSDVVLSKVIRSHAVTLIKLFETQFVKIGGSWPGIPDRWKCHQIIHEILADRTDGLETAQWFKYPIETYFDSADQVPYGYFKKIKHPMDLGTVSAKLHLGVYHHAHDLLQDLKLIFDNCIRYWSPDPHGVAYCESAKKLLEVLKTQSAAVLGPHVADKVLSKDKVSKSSSSSSSAVGALPSTTTPSTRDRKGSGASSAPLVAISSTPVEEERSRKRSSKHISSSFPQKDTCMEILKLLRQHKMRGYNDIEILTAGPFLHAVDVTKYPDYLQVVSEPMDFAKIERKLKGDRYSDVNEFSADVHLIFSNCHKYNSDPIEGADIRAMASNLRDYFVDLYNEKFGNGDKVMRSTSSGDLVKLPSAKLESSRSEQKSALQAAVKKTPLTSPTQHSSAPSSSVAIAALQSTPEDSAVTEAGLKVSKSSVGSSNSTISSVLPPTSLPSSSSASGTKSSTANMTQQELEDYKKRKKEKKEKREKKDKKKKDKKEKKKKDKDKKDKKEKDKSTHGGIEADTPLVAAPTSVPSAASSRPSSTPIMATSAVVSAPPARQSHVPSKISPAESSATASKSKTKKSKKSELSGWEASAERVLNRLVKIEQVTKLHFDQPLLEVFPQLEQDYRRLVHEPMDLRTLREKLQTHSMGSSEEFIRLGRLIFQNAIKFNCAPDPASAHVREMSAHLLWYFESLCSELKLTDSSNAGSQLEHLRRQRAELVNSTPMEVKAKECQKLLRVLNSQKYDKNCWPFRKPAAVLFPTLPPEYFEIIKTPMDLATIADKLTAFEYKVHGEFIRDVRLTFENAIRYNHADKDREGWNVYSAAVQMLAVVDEQWCDVTLEVMERVRRREIVRKERERIGEKRKGDKRSDGESRKAVLLTHARPTSGATPHENGPVKAKPSTSTSENLDSSVIAKASITIAPPSSKDSPESSTTLRLQIVNRPNIDRMNKSERKAEEKRRKRLRREEELARSEKRRRTAVAATDDALREAELRSRRRIQKLEIAEAVKQREERERQQREEEAAKTLAVKMKFNPVSWTGQLGASGAGFWIRKPAKLKIPVAFQTAVDSH